MVQRDTSIPPGAVFYKSFLLEPKKIAGGDALLSKSLKSLANDLRLVVKAEGPISKETAKRRLRASYNTRKGVRIDTYLDDVIQFAISQSLISEKEFFLWPTGMTTPPLRIHIPEETVRSLDEIDPEEQAVAVKICVKHALGILQEDLVRECLKLFGLMATRENSIKLQKIIETMAAKKILEIKNGKISQGSNFQSNLYSSSPPNLPL